jgi:hypothetical protein
MYVLDCTGMGPAEEHGARGTVADLVLALSAEWGVVPQICFLLYMLTCISYACMHSLAPADEIDINVLLLPTALQQQEAPGMKGTESEVTSGDEFSHGSLQSLLSCNRVHGRSPPQGR